jgi:hypothetical protein
LPVEQLWFATHLKFASRRNPIAHALQLGPVYPASHVHVAKPATTLQVPANEQLEGRQTCA